MPKIVQTKEISSEELMKQKVQSDLGSMITIESVNMKERPTAKGYLGKVYANFGVGGVNVRFNRSLMVDQNTGKVYLMGSSSQGRENSSGYTVLDQGRTNNAGKKFYDVRASEAIVDVLEAKVFQKFPDLAKGVDAWLDEDNSTDDESDDAPEEVQV